jgi:hypothetical protein
MNEQVQPSTIIPHPTQPSVGSLTGGTDRNYCVNSHHSLVSPSRCSLPTSNASDASLTDPPGHSQTNHVTRSSATQDRTPGRVRGRRHCHCGELKGVRQRTRCHPCGEPPHHDETLNASTTRDGLAASASPNTMARERQGTNSSASLGGGIGQQRMGNV